MFDFLRVGCEQPLLKISIILSFLEGKENFSSFQEKIFRMWFHMLVCRNCRNSIPKKIKDIPELGFNNVDDQLWQLPIYIYEKKNSRSLNVLKDKDLSSLDNKIYNALQFRYWFSIINNNWEIPSRKPVYSGCKYTLPAINVAGELSLDCKEKNTLLGDEYNNEEGVVLFKYCDENLTLKFSSDDAGNKIIKLESDNENTVKLTKLIVRYYDNKEDTFEGKNFIVIEKDKAKKILHYNIYHQSMFDLKLEDRVSLDAGYISSSVKSEFIKQGISMENAKLSTSEKNKRWEIVANNSEQLYSICVENGKLVVRREY